MATRLKQQSSTPLPPHQKKIPLRRDPGREYHMYILPFLTATRELEQLFRPPKNYTVFFMLVQLFSCTKWCEKLKVSPPRIN